MTEDSDAGAAAGGRGRQPRAERTRRALLDAALRLIARRGLGAVTFREVASEAGASLGVTTYHFPSRRDLLRAALDAHLAEQTALGETLVGELVAPVAGDGTDGAGGADLDALTDAVIEMLWRIVHPDRDTFVAGQEFALEAARDPELALALASATPGPQRMLEQLLTQAGSEDPALDAELLTWTFDGLARAWIQHPDDRAFDAKLGRAVHRILQRFV